MFIASEPTDAGFGVRQASWHIGAGLVNEPGGLMWEDLRSPDTDAARLLRDFETPYGRMAGLADPAGAPFWDVETSGEGRPDQAQ